MGRIMLVMCFFRIKAYSALERRYFRKNPNKYKIPPELLHDKDAVDLHEIPAPIIEDKLFNG